MVKFMMIIFVAPVLIKDVDWPYRPLTKQKFIISQTNSSLGKQQTQQVCAVDDDTIIATS